MLSTASRLAVPAFALLVIAATPAAAQSGPADAAAPAVNCVRTISQAQGAAAASEPRCSEPRDRIFHGGWLGRAIILLDRRERLPIDRPTAASRAEWREMATPVFARTAVAY